MIFWLYFATALLVYLGMARHYGDEMLESLEKRSKGKSAFVSHMILHASLIFASSLWFLALILVAFSSKKKK